MTNNKSKSTDPFVLDNLASEIDGIASNLLIMSHIVEPKQMQDMDTPTEETIEDALYSIVCNLNHVADSLRTFESRLMAAQAR